MYGAGPEQLAPVVGFLATHERRRGAAATPSYALVGIDEHDRIELPQSVHQALTKVVAELHAGKAVTIAPQTMQLTTSTPCVISRTTVGRLTPSRSAACWGDRCEIERAEGELGEQLGKVGSTQRVMRPAGHRHQHPNHRRSRAA